MRTLKKYPNRRLYDTSQSCYITVDNVRELVLGHERLQVADSKSGKDLTRSILLQIFIEQENNSVEHVLNNKVLQQLIRFHGSKSQVAAAQFLEQSISFFLGQQELIQDDERTLNSENSPTRMLQKKSPKTI